MNTPQIVFAAGRETGHYVLQHIRKGAFFAVLLLVHFIGYRLIGWMLARWGGGGDTRTGRLGIAPVLMFLLSLSVYHNPIGSAFGRHLEHQADQYGLEVTHGLTPDSGQWQHGLSRFLAR
jgi:Zn-dependent protease with chaperone function